jgi:ribonucleotide reductase alpha subunit
MSSSRSSINPSVFFLSLVNLFLKKTRQEQHKTFDYTQSVLGRDYVFETTDDVTKAYMTAYGKGIRRGDYIILQRGSQAKQYQVEEIDYYSDPSDMWIALLNLSSSHQ